MTLEFGDGGDSDVLLDGRHGMVGSLFVLWEIFNMLLDKILIGWDCDGWGDRRCRDGFLKEDRCGIFFNWDGLSKWDKGRDG